MNCALIGIYPRCRSCAFSSEPTVHQSQREHGEVPVSLSPPLSLSLSLFLSFTLLYSMQALALQLYFRFGK